MRLALDVPTKAEASEMGRRWWRRLFAPPPANRPGEEGLPPGMGPSGPVGPMAPEVLFTPAAMQRAWRAIRAAGGGPGVDGQTLQGFERHLEAELERLRGELVAGSYRPQVVRQVLVPKRKEGLRPLAMWCLRDRVAQRAVYDIVAPSFESVFLPVSFGFRPGLGTQDAAAQVAAHRDQGLQWVVDADIDSCFDSIRRGRLLRLTARRVQNRHVLGLIEAWLEARILNTASGRPAAAAVAQGGVLSPLLANVYLHEFDRAMVGRGLALVRYADDLVVCCRRKGEAEAALKVCGQELGRLELRLNVHKTRVVHVDQGFKFVGHFFVRREVYVL